MGTRGTHPVSYTMGTRGTHPVFYTMGTRDPRPVSYTMGTRGTHLVSYTMGTRGPRQVSYTMSTRGPHPVSYTMGTGGTHPVSYTMGTRGTHPVSYTMGREAVNPEVKENGKWRRLTHLVPRLRISVPVTPHLTRFYGLHRDNFTFIELKSRTSILRIQVFRTVTLHLCVGETRRSEVRQCCLLQGESTPFLWNIACHSLNNTVSHSGSSHSWIIFKVYFNTLSQLTTRTTEESRVTSGSHRNFVFSRVRTESGNLQFSIQWE